MQTLLLTVLVLGVIVFVHELGHFLTAKWCGVAVPRFSIGLGPRLVGVKAGETDYCLSAVPFGGYVKMAGMEGEEAFEAIEGGPADDAGLDAEVPSDRRFDSKSRWQRLLILSAGVLMNFLLGWGIYVALAWKDGIPTVEGTAVSGVDSLVLQAHPELASLAGGEEIVAIDGNPVENWYDIGSALESGRGDLQIALASGRSVVIPDPEGGVRRDLMSGLQPLVPSVVAQVEPGSPAERAGIAPGDRILSIDGIATPSFGDVSGVVRTRPNQLLSVVVARGAPGGEAQPLSLTVRTGAEKAPRASDGRFVDTGYLGVGTEVGRIELGPVAAVEAGTRAAWRAGTLIVGGLYDLVTGGVSMKSLGGPVAIGQLTGHFARQGTSSLLAWVALFSINLAILNLLPIPVLDGGHILFLGVEALRGRPLSARQKLRLSQVGFAFLVLLMAWAFTADILRLVGF